ncbi:glutathione hydrolase 1 proenzyme [Lingula anatina]|uniref:Glutathione hydrolase 1 proenzyme n=1 Tax=Lingula anatina TaxID=7574 RepID=A0A1S3KHT9_LINAN|nr:glutathione hydrolase 1 proenzyme [Lingula anatina]|eukprot:XP_013421791.1 glutathione hydrolase 1 proenzyme [Lingula anatina]
MKESLQTTEYGRVGQSDGICKCISFRKRNVILLVLLVVALVVLLVVLFATGTIPVGGSTTPNAADDPEAPPSASRLGEYRFAAVAADAGECSKVGTEFLARCGSAVDATIATLLCIGVHNAHSMGVGGGFFMTVYNRANKTAHTIDAREQAPAAAYETMFTNNPSKTATTIGGLAIGVPGEIRGYWLAHQRFGKLPWRELFVPTINMCRSGIKVGKALEKALIALEKYILNDASLSEVFAPRGKILKAGDMMYRYKLAVTLEKIANATDGVSEFYDSELTRDIVDEIQEKGGIITRQDMREYTVKEKEPLTLEMNNGMKVYTPRPPSSGAVYQFILNILQGYNFTTQELHGSHAVRTYHRMVEAMKFAYAKRTEFGDEDYLRNTTLDQLVKNMTSLEFGDHIRSLITDSTTHDTAYYGPTFYDRMTEGTSHLSVLAGNGDAVAVTSTINLYLGSRVRGKKTGIIYNNQMDDFSSPNITNAFGIAPSPNNFIRPGKRPLSSMCPTIIVNKDGDVILVVGASGGSRITTAIAYVTARTLWFGENIKQAIDARRIHHQLLPPEISYEEGFRKVYISGLRALNHNLTDKAVMPSVVQGIHRSGSAIYANSDFRKGGYPDGY